MVRKSIYKQRTPFVKKAAAAAKAVVEEGATKTKKVGGAKNGGERTVPVQKASRFYPTEDGPVALKTRKSARIAKLKASLTPGTVVIILSGPFKGKRAVFLKQLESGLCLITGPFKVNGVPLRRADQVYLQATSTKIDVSQLSLPAEVNDELFAKTKDGKKKKGESDFMQQDASAKKPVDQKRIDLQKKVDDQLLPAINKDSMLAAYLHARFSLQKGQYPHAMKF
eukprot:Clim_evm15s251 gene=Clim_evmTU15s251